MQKENTQSPIQRSAIVIFLAIIAFYLFTEHEAHLYGVLPYVLILLCPLMHFFIHKDHSHPPSGEGNEKPGSKQDHKGCH
jgi:hypothetical protein